MNAAENTSQAAQIPDPIAVLGDYTLTATLANLKKESSDPQTRDWAKRLLKDLNRLRGRLIQEDG